MIEHRGCGQFSRQPNPRRQHSLCMQYLGYCLDSSTSALYATYIVNSAVNQCAPVIWFVCCEQPDFLNLCFWYVPESIRSMERGTAYDEALNKVD